MTGIGIERLFGRNAGMIRETDFRLLLAANAIGALGTALVSPLLDTLTGPFGVSAARIGLIVTAFAAPAVVMVPLGGVLVDRVGRKPILVTGLLCFAVGGTAIAFTTDFRIVLTLRVLQGIGFAGVIPVIITCLGDLYEDDAEATAQGLRFGVSGLSQAVFPATAGVLVVLAWQYPFFIYGLGIPVAAAIWLRFEEPTDVVRESGTRAKNSGEKRDVTPDSPPDRPTGYVRRLLHLASRRRVYSYLLARAIIMVPFIGFLTYNSLVVVQLLDGSPREAGIIVALFSLVYAATATQAGRITALFERRTIPLLAANVLLGGGLVGFGIAPSMSVAILAACVLGVGVGITFSLYRSIITGLAPDAFRGGLVSLGESGGRLVSTLTPIGMGGAIALGDPMLGAAAALQWTVVGAGVLAGAIGVASVVSARTAPPVSDAIE
ncbi:major facilitator superfamily MFS_1 [Halalkaliarchaeum desulfuricum]|uniref:Major facilitator superfamily MFS_1 n=1 Tax=Halalkaliarchaeum desulfuricum TaxID=2055893 RepID=A0A343TLS7_9EURY|nr:MFS transporter [Halalkaliarchaeum desulfuricum]AUX10049.1 major facilitator superfamily MFS_1 [Halalkaliarchaeum desulfuricum]